MKGTQINLKHKTMLITISPKEAFLLTLVARTPKKLKGNKTYMRMLRTPLSPEAEQIRQHILKPKVQTREEVKKVTAFLKHPTQNPL